MKRWNEVENVRIFAIVEISQRGRIGVVMTSCTGKRSLSRALSSLVISNRSKSRFEVWEFAAVPGEKQ